MYVLKRSGSSVYIGTDPVTNKPTTVQIVKKAKQFENFEKASNYKECLKNTLKKFNWDIVNIDTGDTSKNADKEELLIDEFTYIPTDLESEDFDVVEFFKNTVKILSQSKQFIKNMECKENECNMKILDIRHYIRDENHKLNAIQMQRLGYCLRDIEKQRYKYKMNKLIALEFIDDMDKLKQPDSIMTIQNLISTPYKPRILSDSEIESIINNK